MAEQEIAAVQLATMDDLTLLSNRRGFASLGQHALTLCARMERPAWLHFFDLDDFKQVNDRFGHAEGDRALRSFAALLLKTFRDSDVVGRLGGDEFVVLVTNCTQKASEASLRRLRKSVDAHNRSSSRGYDIGFSVGAVAYEPIRHSSIETLLADADKLMYERKRQRQRQPA
jgi:diguanylate cyclase (GGDEF)-like protein